MGTELNVIKETGRLGTDLQIKSFCGPVEKGEMLQLTQGFGNEIGSDEPGFIQITKRDADLLIDALTKWKQS